MNTDTPLLRAVHFMGSWAALARALQLTPMAVMHWRARGVPVERCKDIEIATAGAVRRHELRPDVFDAPAAEERVPV